MLHKIIALSFSFVPLAVAASEAKISLKDGEKGDVFGE